MNRPSSKIRELFQHHLDSSLSPEEEDLLLKAIEQAPEDEAVAIIRELMEAEPAD